MICPKCCADTKVIDSRPHREDARVVVRKRVCEGCGQAFRTQEGTIDIVARRRLVRVSKAKMSAERRAAESYERQVRKAVAGEAAEKRTSHAAVRLAMGLPAKASRVSSLNPVAQR